MDLQLDTSKTVLLSMDYHNIVYALSKAKERNVTEKASKVLQATRSAGGIVMHVAVHRIPGFTSPRNKFVSLMMGRNLPEGVTPQTATGFVPGMEPADGEPVIHKPRISAFYGSELIALLHSRDIDTLVIQGLVSEFVVEGTVREAVDRDYRVFVLEDCCAGFSDESHQAAFKLMEPLCHIVSSADYLESIGQKVSA
jgi:nicotinamidase-related amidase